MIWILNTMLHFDLIQLDKVRHQRLALVNTVMNKEGKFLDWLLYNDLAPSLT
jgi:hypothetical protein